MQVDILAFGIAKDILGSHKICMPIGGSSIDQLKIELEKRYPELKQLSTYLIAVNNEYADEETVLHESDEIAIIPPVSGG